MKRVFILSLAIFLCVITLKSQQYTTFQSIQLYGNDHFSISQQPDMYSVSSKKDKYETITIKINPQIYSYETLKLQLSSSQNVEFEINLLQINNEFSKEIGLTKGNCSKIKSFVELDLRNYIKAFDDEVLLILHIQKGQVWDGVFNIKTITTFDIYNEILLYPNPSTNYFSLNLGLQKAAHISIFNEQGALVQYADFESNKPYFHDLKSGNYFLLINLPEKVITKKFTVIN